MKSVKFYMLMFFGLVVAVLLIKSLGHIKVEGSEAVVKQHLINGVEDTVWRDGTHFYFGLMLDPYKYDIGTQKITFDSEKSNANAEYPCIHVNLGENGGQQACIALSANYRVGWEVTEAGPVFSPRKLVLLHKDGIGLNYEDVILKRTILDVVNKVARPNDALHIYSGKGFVEFKESIDSELKTHPVFKQRGIYIENTIVYQVHLDPKYEAEIKQKQIAIQQKLRKIEETKAAEEEARRAFALAQADVEKRTQAAEALKIERIKAAEAEKSEQVLKAEGKRDSDLAKAVGILEIGKANAEAEALMRNALYDGPSGSWRAKVHIAEKQAERLAGMFKGVQIVPEKTILRANEIATGQTGMAVDME